MFVVRITNDPVYATPIFTTMGGKSKCPAETGTLGRESKVKIRSIKHRCGSFRNLTCDEASLTPGAPATMSLVISNESPTGMIIII